MSALSRKHASQYVVLTAYRHWYEAARTTCARADAPSHG
jgi:hypothetical protein